MNGQQHDDREVITMSDLLESRRLKLMQSVIESLDQDFGGSDDQFERLRDRDGDGWTRVVPNVPTDRRGGSNWPFWKTEQELARLRQESRMVCRSNSYGIGLLGNLVSHSIGKGFTYKAVPLEKKDADEAKPGHQIDDTDSRYCEAVQAVVDDFCEANRWNCTADPLSETALGPTRERETCSRVYEDGEAFLRLFFVNEEQFPGKTYVRFVEPEQIRNPDGLTYRQGWSFGIRHQVEPYEDVERICEYHAVYTDQTLGNDEQAKVPRGECIPAAEIVHIKRSSENAGTKRGTPAFVWSTGAALRRAEKGQRFVSIGAAIRAATAEIWKHEFGTQSQISSLASGFKDRTRTDPVTGRTETIETIKPGAIRRIPQGQDFVPPPSSTGVTEHLQAFQGDLRMAGAAFAAPEYMVSADASNANYSSTKEAGTPFVRSTEGEQEHFKAGFLKVIYKAVKHARDCGRLPEDVFARVKIQVEASSPVMTDPLQQTQRYQILNQSKVMSAQTWAAKEGLEPETEMANIAEFEESMGPQAGPMDPNAMFGGDPKMPPKAMAESLVEGQWEENKHKRDEDGKFSTSSDGGAQGDKKKGSALGTIHDAIIKSTGNMRGWLKQAAKSGESHKAWMGRAEEHIGEAKAKIDKGMRKELHDFRQAITNAYGDTPKTRQLIAGAKKAIRDHRDTIQNEVDSALTAFESGNSKDIEAASGYAAKAMFAAHRDITRLYQDAWKSLKGESKAVREAVEFEAIVGRRLLEAKDASGHEHAKDGKFTGSGGGGSGGAAKARSASQKPSHEVVDNNVSIFGNNVRKALASVKAGKISLKQAKARIAANAAKASEVVSRSFDREWGTFKRKIETHFADSDVRTEILRDFRDTLKGIRAKVTSKIDDIHWATDSNNQKVIERAIDTARIAADGMNEDITEAYKEAAGKLKNAPRRISESLDDFEIEALLESQDDTDERLDLIAEIVSHLFGEQAAKLFDAKETQESLLEWNESDHPRAKDGKFGDGGGEMSKVSVGADGITEVTPIDETGIKRQEKRAVFHKTGEDLGHLFHGGVNHVLSVDSAKLQARDHGFFGHGFYVTNDPKMAKRYGQSVTKYQLKPNAKVLESGPLSQGAWAKGYAHPELEKAVKDFIKKQGGNPETLRGKAWDRAVDSYAEHHGFDAVKHRDNEIVIKNIKAIANASAHKAMRESLIRIVDGIVLLEWNAADHPRGKNGRFIPKGSAEAVGAAKQAIKNTLKNKTPDQHQKLVEHLNILTTKQLRDLKKEYGISASGANVAEVRAKLAERLGKARSGDDATEATGDEPGYSEWAKGEREKNKDKGAESEKAKEPWEMTAEDYAASVGAPKPGINLFGDVSRHQLAFMSDRAKKERADQQVKKNSEARESHKKAIVEWSNHVRQGFESGKLKLTDFDRDDFDADALSVVSDILKDKGIEIDSPFRLRKRSDRGEYLRSKENEYREAVDGKPSSSPPQSTPQSTEPIPKPTESTPQIASRITKHIQDSQGLTDDQRQRYQAAAGSVLALMPPKAHEALEGTLKNARFHKDGNAMALAVVDAALATASEDQQEAIKARRKYIEDNGLVMAGAFLLDKSEVHLDGDIEVPGGGDASYGKHGEKKATMSGTYAHEFAHAIDGPDFKLSKSPEWMEAYNAEIMAGRDENAALTSYAQEAPYEGFAEFGRLLYGSDVPLAQIEQEFPACSGFFKSQGLWPTREGGEANKLEEKFDRDGRLDMGEAGHADVLIERKGKGNETK